ncbi:MAG: alcohol dehydrogenase catalytic domain-containing protein [Nitrospirae bacterium]|nr:alcohol dehydrogenase catalytic domain-containing protein [Nitrospirota bacterium]
MRVAVYYNNMDVRIEEMPTPVIKAGEMVVKVMASGICGSDVMEWYRVKMAPIVLGHEISGEVVEIGGGVEQYKKGDRVFVSHHVPCNTCRYCLNGHHTACDTLHKTNFDPGGFSEYIRVPKINVDRGVFVLPDNVTFSEGTFIEPLACVLRSQRLANIQPGQSILIMGSGISGLLHIHLARCLGAGRIIATDINEYRLNAAKKFGADTVINARGDVPALLLRANKNRHADLVIICTGAMPAMLQALRSVDRGGTVLFFAVPEPGVNIPVPMNDLWRNEIKLITSYGASPADIQMAIDLISNGRVNVNEMITHRLSLSEAGEGFRLVAKADESIKVIIEPHR